MKYYSTLGVYKNSSDTNYYDPSEGLAISYEWVYYREVGGKCYFNDYYITKTTARHQAWLREQLLKEGKRFISVYLPKGFEDLESGLEYHKEKIKDCEATIVGRSRAHTKDQARKSLDFHFHQIELIKELKEAL